MISNLYKIRWREEKSKYKKEEMMRYNGKVKSIREIKRQKRRGNVGGREEEFYLFIYFRIGR